MVQAMPPEAAVVVIGGGVVGLSAAYHLAQAGVGDVVLVERDALGEGSTSKAAGGVRALFSDEVNIRLGLRSLEVFERFGERFDTEIDLHQVGYLFLIDNAEHERAFAENIALQNALGVPSRIIGVDEAQRLSPLIDTTGLRSALWSPRDGHCTPESVVQGYARAARALGVHIATGCEVVGIEVEGNTIAAVETTRGRISTTTVVCAAGAWSRAVGAWLGVELPVTPLRRQIAITEPIAGIDEATPFTIDFSTSFYFHREGPGLLLGMSEESDSWGFDLSRPSSWLATLAEAVEHRAPAIGDVGLRSGWAGLYEMTPDHNAVIGEACEVSRFIYATGFSGHGFLMGPAVGEVVRDLVLGQPPVIDVSSLGVERFSSADARRELNII